MLHISLRSKEAIRDEEQRPSGVVSLYEQGRLRKENQYIMRNKDHSGHFQGFWSQFSMNFSCSLMISCISCIHKLKSVFKTTFTSPNLHINVSEFLLILPSQLYVLYYLSIIAVINYHEWCGLNNRNLLSYSFINYRSKSRY